jgi:tetratricopeptide (TPR) repeat protein
MTNRMRQIMESKRAVRQRLAMRPFSEKLVLLEKLRDRSQLIAYASLLKEHHELIAAGIASERTSDLQARMEGLAKYLTPKEIDLLDGLSIDLQMLRGEEVYEQGGGVEWTPERMRDELKNAWLANDRESILRILRKRPLLPAPQTAFIRARSYEALGLLDIAVLFMDYASKEDPSAPSYQILAMQLLRQTGRLDEAAQRAESYLKQRGDDLNLHIFASHIVFDFARGRPREEALHVYQRLANNLEQTLLQHGKAKPIFQSIAVLGYLILANCYGSLGNKQKEVLAYESALKLEPQNGLVLTAMGLAYIDSDPVQARKYFRQAVDQNTRAISPYLYLAHHTLTHGNYEDCFGLCEKLRRIANHPSIEATAWHWGAIAGYHLGINSESIRMAFERALSLDPLDEDIPRNFDLFKDLQNKTKAALAQPNMSQFRWETNRVFDADGARRELLDKAAPVLSG